MKLPLWAYYVRIISNVSKGNHKNKLLMWGRIIFMNILIITLHILFGYYFSIELFVIFVVLVNETIFVISECRKENDFIGERSKAQFEEYQSTVSRGKICGKRWLMFSIYIFLMNLLSKIGINKYYYIMVKILYVIYLTG